ncbi:hypothetical protein FBY23_0951 [Nocardioides sp. SLBN-35]|nr:hypothetical protein FBY23_0951 [Nocardioides sp. SLBN-35]
MGSAHLRPRAARACRLVLLSTLGAVSLTGCGSVGSERELTEHLESIDGVADVHLFHPDAGDDLEEALTVTIADDIGTDDLTEVIEYALGGLEDLYGRGYGGGDIELQIENAPGRQELELRTADHDEPRRLAELYVSTREDGTPDLDWTMSGDGTVVGHD